MINLFDTSTEMARAKLLTDQAHRDGSPARRNRTDVKRTADPSAVHIEDRLGAGDKIFSSNEPNVTPMKMLLAKEMTKVDSKRKPPSVVARLMGLEEDPPAHEPILHSAKTYLRKSHSHNSLAATQGAAHQPERRCSNTPARRGVQTSPNETVEYKDVYEICKAPSRTCYFQGQVFQNERSFENKSVKRMETVRQNLMEAKRLATDEKLLHSKELQEALKVLSSNKDLFLKFLEEPNCVLSKQLSGHHTIPAPPQMRSITVLKPIKSDESKGVRQIVTRRVNEQNGLDVRKLHHGSHSEEEMCSQPSRIVVLKPSPGKPSRTKAKLTPRATPFKLIDQNDFNRVLRDNGTSLGSRQVVHGTVQNLREGYHRGDVSLSSSTYSDGYGGDESSFSESEEGGSFSDSGRGSPVSQHSSDCIQRYGCPNSGSSFSRTSHSLDSSVIREAKKRLSERWSMVACDEISQEQLQLTRSTSTLGEMLSLREVKKEDADAGLISVPLSSSTFANVVGNADAANFMGCKEIKGVTRSEGTSSFKERVSNFFFSRARKPTKEKTIPSYNFNERVEVSLAGDTRSDVDRNLETNGKAPLCEDKTYDCTTQTSSSASKGMVGAEMAISSDCPSRNLYKLEPNGCLHSTCDQPSSSSVLNTPSEDSNSKKPESSGITNYSNQKVVARSSAIVSVARSLSWEDANSNVEDADELGCHVLVQKLMSSAGLDNAQLSMVFTGWNKAHSEAWSETLARAALGVEVWGLMRDLLHGEGKFVAGKDVSAGTMMERIVNQELEGRGWAKLIRLEVDEITEEIERVILEELVREAVGDLTVYF